MILDCSEQGKLIAGVREHVAKWTEEFEESGHELGTAKTHAAEHLFKINDDCRKLNEEMAMAFHTQAARGLFASE